MNRLLKTVVATTLILSLQGCFFIFIPGSVTSAISDSITGSEGENCVGAKARVGDFVRTPGGGSARIESLSGTSMRCNNPEMPIRAKLDFDASNKTPDYKPNVNPSGGGSPYKPKLNEHCDAQCVAGGNDRQTCDFRCIY